jgi:hypothetical protein
VLARPLIAVLVAGLLAVMTQDDWETSAPVPATSFAFVEQKGTNVGKNYFDSQDPSPAVGGKETTDPDTSLVHVKDKMEGSGNQSDSERLIAIFGAVLKNLQGLSEDREDAPSQEAHKAPSQEAHKAPSQEAHSLYSKWDHAVDGVVGMFEQWLATTGPSSDGFADEIRSLHVKALQSYIEPKVSQYNDIEDHINGHLKTKNILTHDKHEMTVSTHRQSVTSKLGPFKILEWKTQPKSPMVFKDTTTGEEVTDLRDCVLALTVVKAWI